VVENEWTTKAQHEAYTTIVGLSCLKSYYDMGGDEAASIENPGRTALPDLSTIQYLETYADSVWGYQKEPRALL